MKSEDLKKELLYNPKNGRLLASEETLKKADEFCEGYKDFLQSSKTERLAVENAVKMAEANGFVEFDSNKKYNVGDKVYVNNRGKALALAVIGSENFENGVGIAAAHID